jgi:hypothetical protein
VAVDPRKSTRAEASAVDRPRGEGRVESFGLPRAVFYLVMIVPAAPILGVGGYLLYLYPRPPLIAVPFVLVFGVLVTVATAWRWPTGVAHYRAVVIPSWISYAYLYGAVGWEVARWAAVIPLGIVFGLLLAYIVAMGEPDPEAMAFIQPVERDPDDWRWTTPS